MRVLVLLLAIALAQGDKIFSGPPEDFVDIFNIVEPRGRQVNDAFGYLPPVPTCTPVTVTSTATRVFTSTRQGGRDVVITNTIPAVTTVARATTVFRDNVITVGNTITRDVVQTRTSEVVRTAVQTVGGGQSTRNVQFTVTDTRQVESVRFNTITSEVVRPIEVVRTETSVRPVEVTRTDVRTVTDTRTQPGRNVVLTSTVVSNVQSTVQTQPPAFTQATTQVSVSNVVRATTVTQPPVFRTVTRTNTDVMYATITTNVIRDVTSTQERLVTFTNTRVQSRIETQVVPTTVLSTRVVGQTSFITSIATDVRGVTVTNTRTVDRTVGGGSRVVTSEVVRSDIRTVTEPGRVVTNRVVSTQVRDSIVYRTVDIGRTVTVTRTQTQACATGYNYDAPSNPLTFG